MSLRRSVLVSILAVVTTLGAGCGNDDESSADEVTPSSTEAASPTGDDDRATAEFFFAQTAPSGTLGDGRLVLEEVSPSVLAISVRPIRTTDHLPVADFAAGWDERFGDDPPDAVLSTVVGGEARDVAVVLSEPSFEASSSRVEYRAEPVDGTALPTWDFGQAALFIDSAPVDFYTLELQVGTERVGRRVDELRNQAVTVQATLDGGIEIEMERVRLDGYAEVRNELGEELELTVRHDDVVVLQQKIASNETLHFRPTG